MKIFLILLLTIISNIAFAELLKPNSNLNAKEVVSIQLSALKKNNYPYEDAGINQTWEFAHPSNRIFTGPLEKFTAMMYSPSYSIMLEHRKHSINLLKQNDKIAFFIVELEDQLGNIYQFQWTVEKVDNNTEFENCWMTTSVSTPILLEKSV